MWLTSRIISFNCKEGLPIFLFSILTPLKLIKKINKQKKKFLKHDCSLNFKVHLIFLVQNCCDHFKTHLIISLFLSQFRWMLYTAATSIPECHCNDWWLHHYSTPSLHHYFFQLRNQLRRTKPPRL